MAWIWKWVSGGIGVVAGVLGIVSAVGEPLKVVGDMEVHPTAWVLLATVFTSVCCALVVPGLFERWWAAPRRARVERFRELLPRIQGIREDTHRSAALVEPDEDLRFDIARRMADVGACLRHLGVEFSWVRLFFVDGFFTYSWAFLLADGHFSVRFARGQRPGQRPPASFGRPARPDHGARTLRSSPPPPWTFARRFGTVPWEGRCLCDGRSSDDEVLGTCLLGRVGCHQRSSSHGPTLPPCR